MKLYLTNASIDSIALCILSFIISLYLLKLKEKDKSTWMFLLYFLFNGIFALRNTFHYSLIQYNILPVVETGLLFLFASLFFMTPFSLFFHKELGKKTTRILIAISLVIVSGMLLAIVYNAIFNQWTIFQFTTDQFFFKNAGKLIGMPATVQIIIPATIFFIKTVKFSEREGMAITKILMPKGKHSKACRNFGLIMVLQLFIAMLGILAFMNIIPYDTVKLAQILSTLGLFFIMTILFLNNSPQSSTFMIKIVGISLLTILIIYITLGTTFSTDKKNDYNTARLDEVIKIKEQIIKTNNISGDFIPLNVKYVASKPLSDGFFSNNYSIVFNRTKNVTEENLIKSDEIIKKDMIKSLTKTNLRKKIIDENGNKRKLTEKEAKQKSMKELAYKNIIKLQRLGRLWDYKNHSTFYHYYNFVIYDTAYEVGYNYFDYRNKIADFSNKLFINLILLCLVILILFPLFFRKVITTPLMNLLNGVKKVNSGDLTSEVSVKIHDEIGFISDSFNNMVKSINKARTELQHYSENLEEMVDDRTKELRSTMEELEATNETLIDTRDKLWGEMELAKKIQTVLVPEKPVLENYEISGLMHPADEVGGDYYDIINTEGHDWIIIGDVSGHGVPAGLIMMMVQTSIHIVLKNNPEIHPSGLLESINSAITENIKKLREEKYMTLTVMACHQNGKFNFSGLHQDILIYRNETKKAEVIETDGTWIGIMDDLRGIVEDQNLSLNINDTMLLFTDGVTEAWEKGSIKNERDPKTEMFGQDRLLELFKKYGNDSTETIKKEIIKSLDTYDISDDVTLVIMKRKK